MRYMMEMFAVAALSSVPAYGQSAAYYAGFLGVPASSTYPANPCAQCTPHGLDHYAIQANPNDVKVGFRVLSSDGDLIGAVVAADSTSAIVKTPAMLVRVPKDAFGKSMHGLVLRISRARLEKLAKATPS